MKIIQFNECCPVLTPDLPCDTVNPERITITFDFSFLSADSAPECATEASIFLTANPSDCPFMVSFAVPIGATREETALNWYNSPIIIPSTLRPVTRLDGTKVIIAFTWQWLVQFGYSPDEASARAYILALGNSILTSSFCTYLSGGACLSVGISSEAKAVDYCAKVVIAEPCQGVPKNTVRLTWDGFPFNALSYADNIRKMRIGIACSGFVNCSAQDWGAVDVSTKVGSVAGQTADLADKLNALGVSPDGYYIEASASADDNLVVDFIFPDDESFAFFCANCTAFTEICIRDESAAIGAPSYIYQSIPLTSAVCGCQTALSPAPVCDSDYRYCLPIQPGDNVRLPVDLGTLGFREGNYQIDLCQDCDIVFENVGKLSVNADGFGYIQARIPKNAPNGCYTYCIRASSYTAPIPADVCCGEACTEDWEINGALCAFMFAYRNALQDYYTANGVYPSVFAFGGPIEDYPAVASGCYEVDTFANDFFTGGFVLHSLFVLLKPTNPDCGHTYSLTLYATDDGSGVVQTSKLCRSDLKGSHDATPPPGTLDCPPGFILVDPDIPCAYDCSGGIAENLWPYSDKGTFENPAIWQLGVTAVPNMIQSRYTPIKHSGLASMSVVVSEFLGNPGGLMFNYPVLALLANKKYLLQYYVYVETYWPETDRYLFTDYGSFSPPTWIYTTVANDRIYPSAGTGYWIRVATTVETIGSDGILTIVSVLNGGVSPDNPLRVYYDDFTITEIVPPPAPPTASFLNKNFCSTCLEIGNPCYTMQIRATNNGTGLGIPYATLPANFTLFRIGARLRNPQNPAERDAYVDSRGRHIKIYSRLDREIDLETDYLPDDIHEGIAACLEHDKLELQQYGETTFTGYVANEDYKRADIKQRPEFPLRKASAKLRQTPYDKTNSFC